MDAPVQIGRYEITGLVGEGGMGRVYRARDAQLGRVVAIKMLPSAFAADKEFLRRFEQEARAAAALNHPGVLAIYDVGVHDGAPYLVSELLDGITLRQKLERERLSVRKALDYATQVTDALAAAHQRGIVHRDLKPENLFITAQDRVKILDFGLAKLTDAAANPDLTRIDADGTLPNTVLGTPSYMPPEQARGKPADHRADVFSFGCILYEMLQGKRAFDGDSMADVLGAIMKEPAPPLASSSERPLPPALDGIVQRCLDKDPRGRFQSASDLSFALRSLSETDTAIPPRSDPATTVTEVRTARARRPWLWPAVLGVGALAVGLTFGAVVFGRGGAAPARPIEFVVPPPTNEAFASMPLPGLLPTAPQVGVSPDGRLLAFVAADAEGARRLWIRSIDNSRPRVIEGTDGATSWPFWSPDSRYAVIAVPAKRALMKVDAQEGTIEHLSTLPEATPAAPFVTGSWSEDGEILFSIGGPAGMFAVPASGGTPHAATALDKTRGDNYHSWPQFVGGGRYLLFVRTDNSETNGMYAGRRGSNELTRVLTTSARAVFAAGRLLWAIDERLVGQPFDARTMTLSGSSETIVPAVFQGAGRTTGFWASADALAYAAGDTRERQFRWLDRSGEARGNVGAPGLYVTFDLSSDASRIAVEVSKDATARHSTLSIVDTASGVAKPLTFGDQNDSDPRFGPDGSIAFARNAAGSPGITRIEPASGRTSTLLPRGSAPVVWLEDWAADASSILYRTAANRDAWQLLPPSAEPRRLTEAREPVEQSQLAPDGHWIAYNSAETGRSEVFVSSVPAGTARRQISADGGVQATWRADGKELFYVGLDGGLYAVEIAMDRGGLTASVPGLLFRTPLPVISAVVEQYRPASDGRQFLFCLPLTSVQREPLRVLLNWPAKIERSRAR